MRNAGLGGSDADLARKLPGHERVRQRGVPRLRESACASAPLCLGCGRSSSSRSGGKSPRHNPRQPPRGRGDVLVARKPILRSHWSGTGTSPLLHLRVHEQSTGGATSSSPANPFCDLIGRGRGRPHSYTFVRTSRAREGRRPRCPRTRPSDFPCSSRMSHRRTRPSAQSS